MRFDLIFTSHIPLFHEKRVFHFEPSEACFKGIQGSTLGSDLRLLKSTSSKPGGAGGQGRGPGGAGPWAPAPPPVQVLKMLISFFIFRTYSALAPRFKGHTLGVYLEGIP